MIRLRLWLAMLGLALLPMGGVILLGASLSREADDTVAGRRAYETAGAATTLMAREQQVEMRLVGVAADPDLVRLVDGISGASERQAADRALGTLRAVEPAAVRGACITRTSDGLQSQLVSDTRPSSTAATCGAPTLVARAATLAPGGVARMVAHGPDRSLRLVVATQLPAVNRRQAAVISLELSLRELFERSSGSIGTAAAGLLVDLTTNEIVAGSGREAIEDGTAAGAVRPLGDLGVRVNGILSRHGGTTRDLAEAGWAATTAPLWHTDDGTQLGLVHLWPVVAAEPPTALAVAMVGLAMGVLVVAVALARSFVRPFASLAESQAQLEVLYREAREDSLHDGLTGLGNHRSFQEELDRQLDLFRRHQVPVALMLIDLDDLKIVNDGEGHSAGDQLLLGMANAIRDALRYGDRAFRTGGDEFAIIFPHTDAGSALIAANRLRHFCLRPQAGERVIPFSGGISSVPALTTDRGVLYRQADAALYRCKRQGRGNVAIFDADRDHLDQDVAGEGAAIAVRDAVRTRSLTPVYQPIVDLRNGQILGFEGLIRPGPTTPFKNPGQLFEAAAASGRTVELDLACFEVVAAGARDIGTDRVISINLSPRTLEAQDFTSSWLLETLARYAISPGRVIVELTERDDIGDLERLRRNVAGLQRAGIRLAADDVGAGNAGLRLLSQLRFDIVKIDLTLVQEGAQRDSSRAVVRSLRDLATRQGAVVIAEGVETAEQLRVLRELEIATGQGYLLGRPGQNLGLRAVDIEALASGTVILAHVPAGPRPGDAEESLTGSLA
jgi:diguanylate cyclase (GGDEF)-like protein